MGWTERVNVSVGGSANFLRVGAIGLPPKEELLLRSVVRVLEAQTRRRWEFADAPPYHVTFIGTGLLTEADGDGMAEAVTGDTGIAVRVLPHGERPDVDGSDITLPIRPLNLLPLLDALGDRIQGLPATAPGGKRPHKPQQAAHATRLASLGLPPSAEVFLTRVRQPEARPFDVLSGGEVLLTVDPAAKIWTLPATPNGSSTRVPDLAARFLTVGLEYADRAPGAESIRGDAPRQRLEALLWHLGQMATPGEALRPVASRSAFRLTRWPDFGSIGGSDLVALKLAALLVSRAHRLDELVAASREPRDRIIDILNACALCDLLAADAGADRAGAAVRRPAASSRRYGMVMHVLRTALGMGTP